MINLSILLAILAYFGWGIGDAVGVKLFRKNNPATVTFLSGIYRILILLFLLPLFTKDLKNITLVPMMFNILAGLGSGFGYYFFGKSSRLVNPAIVTAISGGWGGSTLVLSLIFFKETVTLWQWFSISLIFFGLFLTTFNWRWIKDPSLKKNNGFFYILLTLIMWGVCGAFLKIPSVAYGWYWTTIIMLASYFIVFVLTTRDTIQLTKLKLSHFWLFVVMVVVIVIADFGYNSSFQYGGSIAIVGTITGSYGTLSTLLSYFVYKEPLTKKQATGIFFSLIGIILTAYFSSFT